MIPFRPEDITSKLAPVHIKNREIICNDSESHSGLLTILTQEACERGACWARAYNEVFCLDFRAHRAAVIFEAP